jgi:hypothetical protein
MTNPPASLRAARVGLDRLGLVRLAVGAYIVVVAVFVGMRVLGVAGWDGWGVDARAYWLTRDGPNYAAAHPGTTGAFLYAPAFAQLISPLTAIPWPLFLGIWTALVAATLLWLAGRWAVLVGLLPPVAMSIVLGQLDLAFAAVVIVGFRWPIAWALPILTKITPGVGLVWFLVRREWRSLGIALGATIAIVAVSALVDPSAWRGWVDLLLRMDFPEIRGGLVFLPVPLWLRVPAAIALIAWGAATDRPATVPIGMLLALPIVWLNSPTILVALLPLAASGVRTPAGAWLRGSARRGRPVPPAHA